MDNQSIIYLKATIFLINILLGLWDEISDVLYYIYIEKSY